MSLDSFATDWASGMERACWQGSAAILLVWLVCKLLLKTAPAATRAALWWIACLKCLAAVVIASAIAIPILKPESPPPSLAATPLTSLAVQAPTLAEGRTDLPEVRPYPVALGLWMIGLIGVVAWTAIQVARLRSLVSRADSLDFSPIGETAREIGAHMGLDRKPRVVQSPEVTAPLVVGIWQPTIVLPMAFATSLSDEETRMALAHELAHIRRRDLLTGLVPALCQLLFFFLPPIWLALREWSLEREAACDAEALAVTQGTPANYGQMLMKIVTQDHQGAQIAPALGATGNYHTLRKRLEMIKTFAHPGRRARFFTTALMAGGLLLALPWQVTARTAETSATPKQGANDVPIQCQVLDADGKPAANVLVLSQHNADPTRFDGGIGYWTDKEGAVTFHIPWADFPKVSFRADQGDQFSDPKILPVNGRVVIHLHRIPLASVLGTAKDSHGKPLAGVLVYAIFDGTLPFIGDRDTLGGRKTGPDGTYRFDGIYPNVPVKIGAKKDGFAEAASAEATSRDGKVLHMPDLHLASKP